MAERQVCTFRVSGVALGVDVQHVQEVLREQEMTEVPLAPPAVRGLINLRGQIVTAIDMRSCLRLPPWDESATPMNVVVYSEGSVVSLLVDSIGDVLEISDDAIERPPETLDTVTLNLVQGVCKLSDDLLLLLDSAAVTSKGLQQSRAD